MECSYMRIYYFFVFKYIDFYLRINTELSLELENGNNGEKWKNDIPKRLINYLYSIFFLLISISLQ